MRLFNNLLAIAVSLLLTLPALAGDLEPLKDETAFLQKLQKVSADTKTIEAAFDEYKYLSYLKEPQVSKGRFMYMQDDKMRWEQTEPFPYILLVNDDAVRIQDDGKEKDLSSSNRIVGKIRDLMLNLVNGKFHENPAFSPSYYQDDEHYIVVLTPKNGRLKSVYSKIELRFEKETIRLKELSFFEPGGDRNIMKFYNEVFNGDMDIALFKEF